MHSETTVTAQLEIARWDDGQPTVHARDFCLGEIDYYRKCYGVIQSRKNIVSDRISLTFYDSSNDYFSNNNNMENTGLRLILSSIISVVKLRISPKHCRLLPLRILKCALKISYVLHKSIILAKWYIVLIE